MSTQLISIGIDVSQDWLDIYVYPLGHARRIDNNAEGVAQLIPWLQSYKPDRVVCESTGGLERLLMRELRVSGIVCFAVNPSRISGFRQALGRLAKTDMLDAELIALFAARMDIDARTPLTCHEQELKELAARRRQLVDMQTQERNRLKRCENENGKASIHRTLALLKKEREKIEAKMHKVVCREQELQNKMDILTSIPGIGGVVALTLISEMPELGKINDKQVASLAGLAPQNKQSGLKNGRASIRGGRKCVRAALYMAAMSAKRCNLPIAIFYKRLVESGKPRMVALTAAMRKLLIQANTLTSENRKWINS